MKKEGALLMKGTAILFQEDHTVTFLENVDRSTYEDLKKECECENNIEPVFWCEDHIDWDYGY